MSDICIDSGKFVISICSVTIIIASLLKLKESNRGKSHLLFALTLLCIGWMMFGYSLALQRDRVTQKLVYKPKLNMGLLKSSGWVLLSLILIYLSHHHMILIIVSFSLFAVALHSFYKEIITSTNSENITFVDADSKDSRSQFTAIALMLIIISTLIIIHTLHRAQYINPIYIVFITIGYYMLAMSSSIRV